MSLITLPLYRVIASRLRAHLNCQLDSFMGHPKWKTDHLEFINYLIKEYMPSGGGFDCGTTLDLQGSRVDLDDPSSQRLTFDSSYHAMDDDGYYVGWIKIQVFVKPCLLTGIHVDVRLSRESNAVRVEEHREYIDLAFAEALEHHISQPDEWAKFEA